MMKKPTLFALHKDGKPGQENIVWLGTAFELSVDFQAVIKRLEASEGNTGLHYQQTLLAAVAVFPRDKHFLMQFGKLLERLRHDDLALKAYEKILVIDPNDAYARQAVTLLKLNEGDFEGAIADANALLALENIGVKDRAVALGIRATARSGQGDFEGAIADANAKLALENIGVKERAVALGIRATANIAIALGSIGRTRRSDLFAAARLDCESGLAEEKGNKILLFLVAQIDRHEGKHGPALSKARELVSKHNDIMFKVLYWLLAPETDQFKLQLPKLLGREELERIQRLAAQWDESGFQPLLPVFLEPRYGGSSIWREGSIAPMTRAGLLQMGSVPRQVRRAAYDNG